MLIFIICSGQGLPPSKHYVSGSYSYGLLLRAANSECAHTPNTDFCPRVHQLSLNVDKNPEKNQWGAFYYSHPSADRGAEAKAGEGPSVREEGSWPGPRLQAPGSLAPRRAAQDCAAASPRWAEHRGRLSA